MSTELFCDFYPVAFGIENNTFVIPVSGGPGLPHDGNTIIGHLLGQAVHFFFWTNGKGEMKLFHVKHTQVESSGHTCVDIAEPQYVGLWLCQSPNIYIWAVHDF